MGVGGRNRLMHWTGTAIPYKPGKNDLLEATRRVGAVIAAGGGRGHRRGGADPRARVGAPAAQRGRRLLRPALRRAARPDRDQRHELAPVRRPRPGQGRGADRRSSGRPTREAVADADGADLTTALHALVADAPDLPPPGRVGRWLTRAVQRLAGGFARGGPGGLRGEPVWHTPTPGPVRMTAGGTVAATGLSADPKEYRARLAEQADEQIDAWAAELMRDVVIRRGDRQGGRGLPAGRPARRARIRTGVRFWWRAAGGHRARRRGPPDGPGDHACTRWCRGSGPRSRTGANG